MSQFDIKAGLRRRETNDRSMHWVRAGVPQSVARSIECLSLCWRVATTSAINSPALQVDSTSCRNTRRLATRNVFRHLLGFRFVR